MPGVPIVCVPIVCVPIVCVPIVGVLIVGVPMVGLLIVVLFQGRSVAPNMGVSYAGGTNASNATDTKDHFMSHIKLCLLFPVLQPFLMRNLRSAPVLHRRFLLSESPQSLLQSQSDLPMRSALTFRKLRGARSTCEIWLKTQTRDSRILVTIQQHPRNTTTNRYQLPILAMRGSIRIVGIVGIVGLIVTGFVDAVNNFSNPGFSSHPQC